MCAKFLGGKRGICIRKGMVAMKLGLYEQIINHVTKRQLSALDSAVYDIGKESLDPEEARKVLSSYLASVTRRALKAVRENNDDETAVLAQIRTSNEIIHTLRESLHPDESRDLQLDEQGEILTYVYSKLNQVNGDGAERVIRPMTPLSQSSLFTGSHFEPNMSHELQREIVTSDRIDWLVSFIKWSGLRVLMDVLHSMNKYVDDIERVKGLGFCVGVEHALYMAKVFGEAGIPSIALHGNSSDEERHLAKSKLEQGEIKMIFVVDLYNEGVDIPAVNTILFLRPTESLTVFLQQLGRGLRLHEAKECLTVLDFIGQAHQEYNFQDKFRALIGKTKHSVQHYIENGFFNLPRGSFIQLEKQAKEYVLRNLKQTATTRRNLVHKIKYFEGDTGQALTLENFLRYHEMTLQEFYGGRSGKRSFHRLKIEAGLVEAELTEASVWEQEDSLTKRIPALISINSRRLLRFAVSYLEDGADARTDEEQLMLSGHRDHEIQFGTHRFCG